MLWCYDIVEIEISAGPTSHQPPFPFSCVAWDDRPFRATWTTRAT